MRLLVLLACLLGARPMFADPGVPDWARVGAHQKEAAREAGVPVAFENALGMRFVLIPGDTFQMGPPLDIARETKDTFGRAWPHEVRITQPYYLQVTEVTNEQWRRIDRSDVAQRPKNLDARQPYVSGAVWRKLALVDWIGQVDSTRTYRLPTEAEWEHAARAGATGRWYWGNQRQDASAHEVVGGDRLQRVASKDPNAFGLYDMLGNAAELVHDRFGPQPPHAQVDPHGPEGVPDEYSICFTRRTVRGGSHKTPLEQATLWARRAAGTDAEDATVGLRLCVSIQERKRQSWPLRIRARAAETGEDMKAQISVRRHYKAPWQSASDDYRVPVDSDWLQVRVDSLKERVVWDDEVHLKGRPWSKRLQWDLPAYPSVHVRGLIARNPDVPFEKLRVWTEYGGFGGDAEAVRTPDASGQFELGPVPHVPGAPVTIQVSSKGTRQGFGATLDGHLPIRPRTPWLRPRITLKPMDSPPQLPMQSGWGTSEGSLSLAPSQSKRPQTCQVRVRCLDRSGAPIAGALVFRDLSRTPFGEVRGFADAAFADAKGVARFPMLPAGRTTFNLIVNGVAETQRVVETKAGREQVVTLQEPQPGRIELHVQREEGGPAAWADVWVRRRNGRPWFDIDDEGTWHVRPMLDHEGKRVLNNIDAGQVTVVVGWFTRGIEATLQISPGVTTRRSLRVPNDGWRSGK